MATIDEARLLMTQRLLDQQAAVWIIEVVSELVDGLNTRSNQVEAYFNILQAQGHALDKIGQIVNEPRRGRDDETYRNAIFSSITRNRSKGRIEDINDYARSLIGENYLGVVEEFPAGLLLRYTYSDIANITDTVKNAVAAGVSITSEIDTSTSITGGTLAGIHSLARVPITVIRD